MIHMRKEEWILLLKSATVRELDDVKISGAIVKLIIVQFKQQPV